MIRSALLLAALSIAAIGGEAQASGDVQPTSEAAAETAFVEMLPDWNIVGECNTAITPAPADVCYRFTPGRSTPDYAIYSAFTLGMTSASWWVGVIEVSGGWKTYGGGRCDLSYCRLADPAGNVLVGFPNGDANCDGTADSQDALLVLQVVADLVGRQGLPCLAEADVFPDGDLNSLDALSILQNDAGLIGALPVAE